MQCNVCQVAQYSAAKVAILLAGAPSYLTLPSPRAQARGPGRPETTQSSSQAWRGSGFRGPAGRIFALAEGFLSNLGNLNAEQRNCHTEVMRVPNATRPKFRGEANLSAPPLPFHPLSAQQGVDVLQGRATPIGVAQPLQ